MPLLTVSTPHLPTSDEDQQAFMKRLSAKLAQALDKPEEWMMISLHKPQAILFAGTAAPACHAALFSIGHVDEQRNAAVSAAICQEVEATLGVPSKRVYIQFCDVPAAFWGWNGETFA